MLKQIALAATILVAAATNSYAGMGTTNGTSFNGVQPTGIVLSDESSSPTVSRIVLPSGETIEVQ